MILCDHEIEGAIAAGDIVIEPAPTEEQYTSSALDLTMGDEFVAIRTVSEIEAAEPRGFAALAPRAVDPIRQTLTVG